MKAEQNKLVIRVGGGFMSVDDFIEINNPWEQSRKLMSQAAVLRASDNACSNMQFIGPSKRAYAETRASPEPVQQFSLVSKSEVEASTNIQPYTPMRNRVTGTLE